MKTLFKILFFASFQSSVTPLLAGPARDITDDPGKQATYQTNLYLSQRGDLRLGLEKPRGRAVVIRFKDSQGQVLFFRRLGKNRTSYRVGLHLIKLPYGIYRTEITNGIDSSAYSVKWSKEVKRPVEVIPNAPRKSTKEVVEGFLKEVRSGLDPDRAGQYMADTVLAHQVTVEQPTTVLRTPANYAKHVRDFLTLFGKFKLEIQELLADGNKVYVRWVQTGKHLAEVDGYTPTGLPLVEVTSVVYRVEREKIVEYWLQTDRLGFDQQLKQNQRQTLGNKHP